MCEHCHEEEYNAVILNLEDQDLECGVITIFEMDGQDYIALFPMDENGEPASDDVYLYRYHDDGDEPEIEYIDDEDELNAASDCFDEWLDEQNKKDNTPQSFDGKAYTAYEARQKQRKMETAMRAQRQKVKLMESGGADKDEVMLHKAKYQAQLSEYARFSKRMGLKQQRERIYLDMRGRVAPRSLKAVKQFPPEMIQNAGRDIAQYRRYKNAIGDAAGSLAEFGQIKYNNSEKWKYLEGLKEYLTKYPNSSKKYYDVYDTLKKEKLAKGIVLPPVCKQAFILPEGKHEPYHIMQRMLKRKITDDEIRSYMKNADIMLNQWGGKRQAFYSKDGVCVITKTDEGWIYKTAWKKEDFDSNTERILEVIKKYVR